MGKIKEVSEELKRLIEEKKSAKEISKILNVSYSTVHRKLRKLGLNLYNYHNELKFDNTVFDKIDTEEKAYWLGFLYADGYISPNNNTIELTLKESDYNHLVKFSKFLKYSISNPIRIQDSKCKEKIYKRCRCTITDKHLHNKLIELGCIPKKSLVLKFPNLNIFKYKELVYDFIRGYVDGDGCLYSTPGGRLGISVIGTLEFISSISLLYSDLFKNRKILKDKRWRNNTVSIAFTHTPADILCKSLYENATIYLDRKYEIYCRLIQK